MSNPIKTYFGYFLKGLAFFFGFLFLYVLFAIVMSLLPYNKDFASTENGIPLYIISNGIHIDLAFANENATLDWEKLIAFDKFRHDKDEISFYRFGWGDRAFMIETPEWADLTVCNTVKALFFPSESAMHIIVTSHAPKLRERTRLVFLNPKQFELIEKSIFHQFKEVNGQAVALTYEGYEYYDDHFYKGKDSYTMFNTCNNWINRVFKEAGIRTAFWTPFEQAIIHHLDAS